MIFYVEDDKSIRELVVYTLNNTGFEADGFENGKAFFDALQKGKPQLILLDIMLPGEDGIKILKRLRSDVSTKKIPIIMVTAKGAEYDKIIGLDSGADDYVTKPFGMMELVSRIKAVLRRVESNEDPEEYRYSAVVLNTLKHSVTVNGNAVDLTYKEFELLKLLMKNEGIVLTRDKLLEKLWGYDFDGETRTVDVHIRTLRQKLGEAEDCIETIRGVGYRMGGV
jgi:two-component system alkaline phosphatase synthesis response regulator PhoP